MRAKRKQIRPSGSRGKAIKPYKFEQQMSFLNPVLELRPTSSNLPSDADSSSESDVPDNTAADTSPAKSLSPTQTQLPPQSPTPVPSRSPAPAYASAPPSVAAPSQSPSTSRGKAPSTKRKKTGRHDAFETAVLTTLAAKQQKKEQDADEMFLLSLLPALKELDPRQKSSVKIKFQQILHDAAFNYTPVQLPSPTPPMPQHLMMPQPSFGAMHRNISPAMPSPNPCAGQQHQGQQYNAESSTYM